MRRKKKTLAKKIREELDELIWEKVWLKSDAYKEAYLLLLATYDKTYTEETIKFILEEQTYGI